MSVILKRNKTLFVRSFTLNICQKKNIFRTSCTLASFS